MSEFLGEDYLLSNAPARDLYQAVRHLPIIDAHNHADVQGKLPTTCPTPASGRSRRLPTTMSWELLRKRGVDERLITGDAPARDKWLAMAAVFPELAGNPTYEWIHLDLKRLLGIDLPIDAEHGARHLGP